MRYKNLLTALTLTLARSAPTINIRIPDSIQLAKQPRQLL